MTIEYNKKGLLFILLVFVVCVGINYTYFNQGGPIVNAVFYTIGVFFLYPIVLIVNLIYRLIKDKKIVLFTDWWIGIVLIGFELLTIYGASQG